jgi:catalase
MASSVVGGIHKAQETIRAAAGQDKKSADLSQDTADVNAKLKLTTDHGVKISDTDHWLKVANENTSGPSLLEDQIAREKVCPSEKRYFRRSLADCADPPF